MPCHGADIPKRGAEIHRGGALTPDSDRALLQDCVTNEPSVLAHARRPATRNRQASPIAVAPLHDR